MRGLVWVVRLARRRELGPGAVRDELVRQFGSGDADVLDQAVEAVMELRAALDGPGDRGGA